MRLIILAIAFLSGISCCQAQESANYRKCGDSAKTQFEMHVCANEEAKRVDAELNQVNRSLLAALTKDRVATQKVTVAEKAWIAYRDAYGEAMYPAEDKQAEYGTMYPMDFDLLMAKLTREHIQDLKELLKESQ